MYRIRQILNEKGMTAKQLAEKMGVSPQYVSGIIREVDSASVQTLVNISKVLNVPVSSLFDDYKQEEGTIICPHCGGVIKFSKE